MADEQKNFLYEDYSNRFFYGSVTKLSSSPKISSQYIFASGAVKQFFCLAFTSYVHVYKVWSPKLFVIHRIQHKHILRAVFAST